MQNNSKNEVALNGRLRILLNECESFLANDSAGTSDGCSVLKELLLKLRMLKESVERISLFSSNEDISEISTNSLRFLNIPAAIGCLVLNVRSDDRLQILTEAKTSFIEFLCVLNDYGLINDEPEIMDWINDGSDHGTKSNLISSGLSKRDVKIQRYKMEKELKEKLKALKDANGSLPVDEELLREYSLSEVQLWLLRVRSEMNAVLAEWPLAQRMSELREKGLTEGRTIPNASGAPLPPFQPFVITRDRVQQQIFGAGYPSLPTMTVEEWCEREIREGRIDCGQGDRNKPPESNNECLEEDSEKYDDENRRKKQAWDEYKDDHRRGWGNTHNKG